MAFFSDFKVGDKVKLTDDAVISFGKHDSFEIAEIYSDGFGRVALKDVGGYGYGFDYLELDNAKSSPRDSVGLTDGLCVNF